MKLAVTDTETTGTGTGDQVVELAIVTRDAQWSTLVRPTCRVSHEARAAHHVTDEELARAPTMEQLLAKVDRLFGDDDVFVAHNAEFDRKMLKQSGVPILPERTICTWRCSLHLWPNAPRHSNQVLRYYLGLKVPKLKQPPHRALPDAVVTAALLERMLETCSAEKLIQLTASPVLLGTIRFGKYRGMRWKNLDTGYLRWILKQEFDADAKHTARHWLTQRGDL